jgi:hypothetical protein
MTKTKAASVASNHPEWFDSIENHVMNAGSVNRQVRDFPSGTVIYLIDLAFNRVINSGLDSNWRALVALGRVARGGDDGLIDRAELTRLIGPGDDLVQRGLDHYKAFAQELGFDWRRDAPTDVATGIVDRERGKRVTKLEAGELPRQVLAARAGVSDRLNRQIARQMYENDLLRTGTPIPGSYRTRRSVHARIDRESEAYRAGFEEWLAGEADGMSNADRVQRAVETRLHAAAA